MVIISEGLEFIERQQHPQHPERSSTINSANPKQCKPQKHACVLRFPPAALSLLMVPTQTALGLSPSRVTGLMGLSRQG
jgi:hypothetical protein